MLRDNNGLHRVARQLVHPDCVVGRNLGVEIRIAGDNKLGGLTVYSADHDEIAFLKQDLVVPYRSLDHVR